MTSKPVRAKCPTCRKIAVKDGNKMFPFCSERCQLLDLGRWLDEDYKIPEEHDSRGGGAESVVPPSEDDR